jgi:hypothetical protein
VKPQAHRRYFLERDRLERAGISTDKLFYNDAPPQRPAFGRDRLLALGLMFLSALITIAVLYVGLVALLQAAPLVTR